MKDCMGITIGPVFDTIGLAHSPAAMWYASYMFSSLTKAICKNILADNPMCSIVSPHYDENDNINDGVGRYHDRIIMYNADRDKIQASIDKGIGEITDIICDDLKVGENDRKNTENFLKKYFQVRYVYLPEIKDESILLVLGGYLDALEQFTSPNSENTYNPFVKLFAGSSFRNDYVRKSVSKMEGSQLLNSEGEHKGKLKSIDDIMHMGIGTKLKWGNYYAVVEADGDNMSSLFSRLPNDSVEVFSKQLFEYAAFAAKKIGNFGGMTIYAGGDDLLFIAPVVGNDGHTSIFELCKEINEEMTKLFKESFGEIAEGLEKKPAVSFGIAIRREGFPLYEAWNSSMSALYALKHFDDFKNAMYIDLQKGSGQAIKLLVPFETYGEFEKLFDAYADNGIDEELFKSVIYAVAFNENLLEEVNENKNVFINIMKNAYDNSNQSSQQERVIYIANDMYALKNTQSRKVRAFGRNKDGKNSIMNDTKMIEAVLRLSKFMIEKTGREK